MHWCFPLSVFRLLFFLGWVFSCRLSRGWSFQIIVIFHIFPRSRSRWEGRKHLQIDSLLCLTLPVCRDISLSDRYSSVQSWFPPVAPLIDTHTHAHTNTNKREREEEKKERKTKLLYWQREKQGANMFVFCLAQFRTWIQHFQPLFFPSSSSSSSRGIQQLLPTGTERERERQTDRQTDRQTQTKTIWRNTQLQSGLDLCIPKVGRSFLDLSAESNEKKEKKKRKKKRGWALQQTGFIWQKRSSWLIY